MLQIRIKRGLDIPLAGEPEQALGSCPEVRHVALVGDDYVGMKPTMAVKEGDRVRLGELLFTDKKTAGVRFVSPGCGRVQAINRGARRKFESIVIALDGDEEERFAGLDGRRPAEVPAAAIRATMIASGLWTGLRTRPYGKIPAVDSVPHSLFVTAMDTLPLAADAALIIRRRSEDFRLGLEVLAAMIPGALYLCVAPGKEVPGGDLAGVTACEFQGPHPAGLPSTHMHFLDPVHAEKSAWHIGYQDVIGVGHLFRTGRLLTERVIALSGPAMKQPRLVATRVGASIDELTAGELAGDGLRVVSGSVLDGRRAEDTYAYLGRHHQQICALYEDDGRGFLGWLRPGRRRFSVKPVFLSAYLGRRRFSMPTAAWGGRRAIFPLGTYEQVMPLDMMATKLLKSLAVGDTEKAQTLGCLELIEEDLALCSFVCPGKNNFAPMLRDVLTRIETEG